MLNSRINLINFKIKKNTARAKSILKNTIKENNQVILSLGNQYQNSYSNRLIKKFQKNLNFRLIGMGGSSLGAQSIYDFLKHKIKKNFFFIDNLQAIKTKIKKKKNYKFSYFKIG